MNLKESLPRIEAWDAETTDDGWAIVTEDLHKWAETNLAICSNLDAEGTAQYLVAALKELMEYTQK